MILEINLILEIATFSDKIALVMAESEENVNGRVKRVKGSYRRGGGSGRGLVTNSSRGGPSGRRGRGRRGAVSNSNTSNKKSPVDVKENDIVPTNSGTGINFSNYDNIPVTCQGEQPPPPVTCLEEAGLCAQVLENVAKVGFS